MKKTIIFILSIIFIQSNLLFNDVVNSIVGIVGSMPITYEDFISRKSFLTLQARSIGQKINDDMVYKDLVEERIMYLKLKEYNYVIEENDVSRRLENIAKQYNMTLDQFAKQLMAEGISYEEYRNSIKKQIAMENLNGLVVNNTEITDEEADEFYNNTKDKSVFEVDTLVKLSWIFFKAATFTEKGEKQELAKQVRGMAARGQDFAELAKKYGLDDQVVHAIAAHHDDIEMTTPEAVIVKIVDAISAARPGARNISAENFAERMRDLENIATSFPGINKAYAISAGREIRVIVEPQQIDDLSALKLARDIANKIEATMSYPGTIKVNVIRETRAIEYAK